MRKTSVAAKAKKAGQLGARRSALIKRLIALDAQMDVIRARKKSVEFKLDNIDRVINNLGYGGGQ
jgi:transcription initiation factor TFIIIB Brf1 subunit/transcription initiation factor TFIIB